MIEIDDRELSLEEFGRMLTTFAGWGMLITFVPEDELYVAPKLDVRESGDKPWPGPEPGPESS